MRPSLCLLASLCAFCVLLPAAHAVAQQRGQQPAGLTDKQWLESKEAQAHVTAAMAIAKPDLLQEAANLCSARGPQRPAVLRQEAGLPPVPRETLEPARIFDNLYYIGFDTVGAWALTTSQGIIVIDSLNTPEEGEKVLIPGMQKAGLDPKQIKYVIIGHGHFDHFGGTPYLQRAYKPQVLMSGADWDFIASSPQRNRELPVRDVSITDGQTLTLGDTTVTMIHTPGHTRSEEHTSELQSHSDLVCRLLLEKKKKTQTTTHTE